MMQTAKASAGQKKQASKKRNALEWMPERSSAQYDSRDQRAADMLMQAVGVPCARFDAQGSLIAANEAFSIEFGSTADRRSFTERFESFNSDRDALGGSGNDEVYCPANGRSYALHWARPEPGFGDVVTVVNLTERTETQRRHRAMQEQLMFTSRAMSVGEMATTLAHELNQPLAAIINYLSIAQRYQSSLTDAPPRLGEALGYARSQAEHAAAVIARLREFVRSRQPQRESHPPAELVTHTLTLLQLEAQKQRIRVELDLPGDLPRISVDRVMIEQVLANLIKNSIEAMRDTPPSERRLHITALLNADDRVEIRVADRGSGISDHDGAQVFSPFFSTKQNGLGVGLAICRSIIEYHEGSLYFEPNEGGGAVFVFTLTPASSGIHA